MSYDTGQKPIKVVGNPTKVATSELIIWHRSGQRWVGGFTGRFFIVLFDFRNHKESTAAL
jgi:hypothetical protein